MAGPEHHEHAARGRPARVAGGERVAGERAVGGGRLAGSEPVRPQRAHGHRPRRAADDHGTFGSSLGWSLAGTVLPGVGLLQTRARFVGIVLLTVFVLGLVAVGVGALMVPDRLLELVVQPTILTAGWVAVAVFGLAWIGSIVATHLLRRPARPPRWQRLVGSLAVSLLALVVALPSFVGARSLYDTGQLVNSVFGQEGAVPAGDDDEEEFGNATDSWANKPRLNVLVLGGDAGADREGTRTDTVILASINTRTGDTVLFSLPRQTARMPFPAGTDLHRAFPNGFTDGDPLNQNYALNAIYGSVPRLVKSERLDRAEDPGAEALKLAVGEALGLRVDYYAMVNMEGFIELVNALGGITVNINTPVPVGGKNPTRIGGSDGFPPDRWLVPGPDQHLNGADALWFARGRYRTDDYARMSRQRCVIQAVVQQVRPATVLANYEALTKAGRNIVATDMPNRQAPRMVTLALRVKDAALSSVSFEDGKDGFSTTHPDWDATRERVQAAITAPPPEPVTPDPDDPDASADPGAPAEAGAIADPDASAEPTASASPRAEPTASAYP
ncbi:MAG: LCP family protein, partial [Propionibacteriaceae bacterium]|nr:LCP family protein [Propionibacteriaceae bacterium]